MCALWILPHLTDCFLDHCWTEEGLECSDWLFLGNLQHQTLPPSHSTLCSHASLSLCCWFYKFQEVVLFFLKFEFSPLTQGECLTRFEYFLHEFWKLSPVSTQCLVLPNKKLVNGIFNVFPSLNTMKIYHHRNFFLLQLSIIFTFGVLSNSHWLSINNITMLAFTFWVLYEWDDK